MKNAIICAFVCLSFGLPPDAIAQDNYQVYARNDAQEVPSNPNDRTKYHLKVDSGATSADVGPVIDIDLNNVTIEDAINHISERSGLRFMFGRKTISTDKHVSIRKSNVPVLKAIEEVLRDTGLDVIQSESGQLIIIGQPESANGSMKGSIDEVSVTQRALQGVITGTVTDALTNETIPGANVAIQGSVQGAATDVQGRYTITGVEPGTYSVQASFIGYATTIIEGVEVRENETTVVDFVLEAAEIGLDDIVVVGYGTQTQRNITGSVSTIDVDEAMANRPITDVSQAISGKATGVWVNQNSGQPGEDDAQIRIRGWGTLNNAEPLVLIDGIEGSMSNVNPNDIESITILKDAASAAIYGSKAANGVVLITTKSGEYNQGINVEISSYVGLQSLGRRYDLVDNSAEYMRMWNQALINQGGSALFPAEVIVAFEENGDPSKYPNTNFMDHVFRSAPIHNHNVSISNGTESSRYNLNLRFQSQDGIMRESSSYRYGLSFNIEQKYKKWLTIGGRFAGNKRNIEQPSVDDVMYWFANGAYPFIAPKLKDGRFGAPQVINPNTGALIVLNRNPLLVTQEQQVNATRDYYRINAYSTIDIGDHVTFRTTFSTQNNSEIRNQHRVHVTGYTDGGEPAQNFYGDPTINLIRSNSNEYAYTWHNTLEGRGTFKNIHEVVGLAGMQIENTTLLTSFAQRTTPPKSGLSQVDAGTAGIQSGGNRSDLRLLSYFGRLNYSLLNRYLLELDVRADASSRFRKDHRWGVFPGVSIGWRLSEEKFVRDLGLFSDLKLRVSGGRLGNQNVGSFWPYLATIDQADNLSYNFGGHFSPGAAITSLVDETISWETSTTLNYGIDAGFMNNRMSLTFDYFTKMTDDILVQLPIPAVMGAATPPYENVGQMKNEGFEVAVDYWGGLSSANRVHYNIGANFTYVTNEVTKFRGGDSPDQLYLIREGYPYHSLYGFNAIGVYQSNEEAAAHMFANGYTPAAGDLKYEDVNGDGRLDFQDKMVIGNTIPKYMFGSNLGLEYKGFNLNILLQGATGYSIYARNAWTQPFGVSGGTVTKKWKEAWTPDNPSSSFPRLKINDSWNTEDSSFWIQNISYLKIRNVQVGYDFKSRITNSIGLDNIYVYANVQNAYTFVHDSYEGFDPEGGSTFTARETTYPIPRVISLGVKINL